MLKMLQQCLGVFIQRARQCGFHRGIFRLPRHTERGAGDRFRGVRSYGSSVSASAGSPDVGGSCGFAQNASLERGRGRISGLRLREPAGRRSKPTAGGSTAAHGKSNASPDFALSGTRLHHARDSPSGHRTGWNRANRYQAEDGIFGGAASPKTSRRRAAEIRLRRIAEGVTDRAGARRIFREACRNILRKLESQTRISVRNSSETSVNCKPAPRVRLCRPIPGARGLPAGDCRRD